MTDFKRPNVLILQGINRKSYNASTDDDIELFSFDEIIYQRIPKVFKMGDRYPESTNLLCWNCDRSFRGMPIFVPLSVNDNLEFKVEGNMCSFNCTYSWIDTHYSGDMRNRLKDRLYLLYEVVTGKRGCVILPAPSKTLQKKYGGDLETSQFNELMSSITDKL